jgi:hypothetical protein
MIPDIVVATLGLGPGFRRRIHKHIALHHAISYDKKMKYIIITDLVSDFDEIRKNTDLIIDVVDIFELIDKYNIELYTEFIPKSRIEPDYSTEHASRPGEYSYNAKRFALLRLYELGITQFILLDPDHYFTYPSKETEAQFWSGLDIPTNTFAGICHEKVECKYISELEVFQLTPAACMGMESVHFYQTAPYAAHMIQQSMMNKYDIYKYSIINTQDYEQLHLFEGPVRYYNFSSKESVLEYFRVWSEAVHILSTLPRLDRLLKSGPGWMHADFAPTTLANVIMKLNIVDFPANTIQGNVFYEDRYFLPTSGGYVKTNTLKEFISVNKDKLLSDYAGSDSRMEYLTFMNDEK